MDELCVCVSACFVCVCVCADGFHTSSLPVNPLFLADTHKHGHTATLLSMLDVYQRCAVESEVLQLRNVLLNHLVQLT